MNTAAVIRLLGAGFDLTVPLGDGPALPTAGGAVWQNVKRPERKDLTEYVNDELVHIDVPVFFDGYAAGTSVQAAVDAVLALCHSADNGSRPPDFIATGPIPYSGLRCVMERPDFGDLIRLADGTLVRQALTLKLVEFVDPDTIVLSTRGAGSPAAAAAGGGGGSQPNATVTRKGETLLQVSVRVFGKSSRAKEIGNMNGIRDVRLKLPEGVMLRLPPR